MSELVLHEIEAFGALFELNSSHGRSDLRDFPGRSEEWWRANSLLEAFLMHVRILDEFLYGDVRTGSERSGRAVDFKGRVSALEFVEDSQAWLDDRPERPHALRRRRISRTVAHLLWARVEGGWEEDQDLSSRNRPHQKEQEWPVPEIWDALRPALVDFVGQVDEGAVIVDFKGRAQAALEVRAIDR
jgi:hypothetical protein